MSYLILSLFNPYSNGSCNGSSLLTKPSESDPLSSSPRVSGLRWSNTSLPKYASSSSLTSSGIREFEIKATEESGLKP